MAARCEDCGALITGTNAEIAAQASGTSLCEECIEELEAEDDRGWELTQDLRNLPH